MYGRRVPKNDPRVAAYGSVDELTAALGLARALATNQFVLEQVLAVQKDLIVVMGELAERSKVIKEGAAVKVSGFIAKRSLKSTQLVLHINTLEIT